MKEPIKTEPIKVKHKIKDSVFTTLFSDPEYLFQMYQTLHPEDKDIKPQDLTIVTIENVMVNGLYNDLGFTVRDNKLIILVEAQSTWSENILIRSLFYFAATLKNVIVERKIDLYSVAKASIPKPEFYVIYTGDRKDRPENLRLSESFFGGEMMGLDLTITMLYGGSKDIISQYVAFSRVYDAQYRIYGPTGEAITETIRICRNKDILNQFLIQREKEIIDMYLTLFDEDFITSAHEATLIRESIEKGRADERAAYAEEKAGYLSEIAALKQQLSALSLKH